MAEPRNLTPEIAADVDELRFSLAVAAPLLPPDQDVSGPLERLVAALEEPRPDIAPVRKRALLAAAAKLDALAAQTPDPVLAEDYGAAAVEMRALVARGGERPALAKRLRSPVLRARLVEVVTGELRESNRADRADLKGRARETGAVPPSRFSAPGNVVALVLGTVLELMGQQDPGASP